MRNQGWIALSQLINACLFGGWADETISSRTYRNSAKGKPKWVVFRRWIDLVFFWQPQHCLNAYRNEAARLHMPPAYRSIHNGTTPNEITN